MKMTDEFVLTTERQNISISCIISSTSLLLGFPTFPIRWYSDTMMNRCERRAYVNNKSETIFMLSYNLDESLNSALHFSWLFFYSLFIRRRWHIMSWSGNWSFLNFHHCKRCFCIRQWRHGVFAHWSFLTCSFGVFSCFITQLGDLWERFETKSCSTDVDACNE